MTEWRHSVVTRLAMGYGLLLLGTVGVVSALFYGGTSGLLARRTEAMVQATSRHLAAIGTAGGETALAGTIHALLSDDQDVDTEIYLLQDAQGRTLAGNIPYPGPGPVPGPPSRHRVRLHGHETFAELEVSALPQGGRLYVGRDIADQLQLRAMVFRALACGGGFALLLSALGIALMYRRLQRQLQAISGTTRQIMAGQLHRRIAADAGRDEFSRIGTDVNRMLDEIERLMAASRTVSNAIAHHLRTPLARIQGRIEHALQAQPDVPLWPVTGEQVIDEIQTLTAVFEKLLQIAEAEAGIRRQQFAPLDLRTMLVDMVDLYQASAEQDGIELALGGDRHCMVHGDRDLLAAACATVLDNAILHGGGDGRIDIQVHGENGLARLRVRDHGPGVDPAQLPRITERFFRADGTGTPGSGLGLSICQAVLQLHRGHMTIRNAQPGLDVCLYLPLG